jgi:Fanconi-associated nuclease 1
MALGEQGFFENLTPSREEPPLKRLKSEHASDSDSVDLDGWTTVDEPPEVTAVESCLAPVRTDQESINEYESSQAAQVSGSNRLDQRRWVRGQSSIYVDAFNLALETVLDEESHLFNEAERAFFGYWKDLSYEAQYL